MRSTARDVNVSEARPLGDLRVDKLHYILGQLWFALNPHVLASSGLHLGPFPRVSPARLALLHLRYHDSGPETCTGISERPNDRTSPDGSGLSLGWGCREGDWVAQRHSFQCVAQHQNRSKGVCSTGSSVHWVYRVVSASRLHKCMKGVTKKSMKVCLYRVYNVEAGVFVSNMTSFIYKIENKNWINSLYRLLTMVFHSLVA